MTPPSTLLRDCVLAGLMLAALGAWVGEGLAVGVGAGTAVLNFWFLWRAVRSTHPAAVMSRLVMANVVAAVLLYIALSRLSAAPVLVGFLAPLLAFAVRGVAGAFHPSSITERG